MFISVYITSVYITFSQNTLNFKGVGFPFLEELDLFFL